MYSLQYCGPSVLRADLEWALYYLAHDQYGHFSLWINMTYLTWVLVALACRSSAWLFLVQAFWTTIAIDLPRFSARPKTPSAVAFCSYPSTGGTFSSSSDCMKGRVTVISTPFQNKVWRRRLTTYDRQLPALDLLQSARVSSLMTMRRRMVQRCTFHTINFNGPLWVMKASSLSTNHAQHRTRQILHE